MTTRQAKAPARQRGGLPDKQPDAQLAELLDQTLAQLDAAGTAQNRKIYARHGASGEMYGVSYKELRRLTKQLSPNAALASELWRTGNHDARLLAAMIADPAAAKQRELTSWARDLNNYMAVDELAALIARTKFLPRFIERYRSEQNEWLGALAWTLVAHQAMQSEPPIPPEQPGQTTQPDDSYFLDLLAEIEADIHSRPNRCRHSMNGALIAIGCRNKTLRRAAEAAAGRIGKVTVDHGQTSCTTPDAVSYIARTWEHQQRQAAKKSKQAKPAKP